MTKLINIESKDIDLKFDVYWICDCCKCEILTNTLIPPKGWKIFNKSMKYEDREVLCNKCVFFRDIIK